MFRVMANGNVTYAQRSVKNEIANDMPMGCVDAGNEELKEKQNAPDVINRLRNGSKNRETASDGKLESRQITDRDGLMFWNTMGANVFAARRAEFPF
jgi:hypothetical protein